jgi:F420-0:gamma-glutamyl ligase-like protein
MKKLFIISLLALIVGAVSVSAQRIDKTFAVDTVKATTKYYTSPIIKSSDGVLGFLVNKKDIADSLSVLKLQGAMESAFAYPIDLTGTAALANTTTDGTVFLYVSDPIYLYYRLKATAATGDTVALPTVRLIYK